MADRIIKFSDKKKITKMVNYLGQHFRFFASPGFGSKTRLTVGIIQRCELPQLFKFRIKLRKIELEKNFQINEETN